MAKIIFYAWQSDSDPELNRSFIYDCLQRAIKKLNREDLADLIIDRDTRNVPGMPDIGHTIMEKIERCAVIVADLSIINPAGVRRVDERPVPNPNVLFEIGYAFGKLGPTAIVGIFNTASGTVDELPFDLRPKRLMPYHLASSADKAKTRERLVDDLAQAIKGCLGETEEVRVRRVSQIVSALSDLRLFGTEIGEWRGIAALPKMIQVHSAAVNEVPDLMVQCGVAQGTRNLTVQVMRKMESAATLACNDENWPTIEQTVSSAGSLAGLILSYLGYKIEKGYHDLSVSSVVSTPSKLDAEIQNLLQNGELRKSELERITVDLRKVALMPLIPEHPPFATGLNEISLDFRRLFLRWWKNDPTKDDAISALRDIRDRLSLLVAKYASHEA